MRRLTVLTMSLALIVFSGCKQTADDRYQRYLEDVADTTFEYVTPKADSLNADGEPIVPEGQAKGGWANDDGLVAVPDIPKERRVNKGANSYDVERAMLGKE